MKIYCCQEHVELALDIIVDDFETAPFIHKLDEEALKEIACEYCKNQAEYVVSDQ